MASIQERLQLKRVPLDKWSTKEKLCLASAVACSGDQNWMSVSRSLKMLCGANRPADWFSQKSCAAQYGKLLENVETPKRKKRTASERDGVAAVETPGESILRKLTQEKIIELKKIIQEEAQQYTKVKEDIILIQSGVTDEKKLREMWKQIQMEKAQKEKEQILHAQWLKEREEKKLELERQWRPLFPNSPNSSKVIGSGIKIKEETDEDSQSSSKSGTSPLLTSLLKSPSGNPSGSQGQPSSGNSRTAASPTITNLLTGSTPTIKNIPSKNLFPVTGTESAQQLEGSQRFLQDTVGSSAYQVAPNLTKLLDSSIDGNKSVANVVQGSPKLVESTVKSEDTDTDPENADPAKDLMAVFQELMPEELDEILNENSGMILEDEILDNVVDSIMEEEEEEEEKAGLKGKDLNALEGANLMNSSTVEDQDDDLKTTCSKNDESTHEVSKGAYMKPAVAAPSPQRLTSFGEDSTMINNDDMAFVDDVNIPEKKDDASEAIPEETPVSTTIKEELIEEETKELKSTEEEIDIPLEDNSNSSPNSNLPNIKNKENVESIGSDSTKQEESIIKTESEDDTVDKLPVSENISVPVRKELSIKSEEAVDIKLEVKEEEFSESGLGEDKFDTIVAENKLQQSTTSLNSEEEAARAKKEALEKLASEYDFKDDEEPIVPLSIQKSKEEKHIPEEDVYMDAQESLEESNSPKETEQKKHEDSIVTITDTDDDSLIEMKISKTKRDYSRRRTVDELSKPKDEHLGTPKNEESEIRSLRKLRDRDRSISPFVLLDDDVSDKMKRSYSSTPVMDSIPSSPASSEDRDYRVWKKTILSIHTKLSSLRQASAFMKPLPEDQISDIIYRPMDLSTIRKNIENGTVRTTSEYQRDVMLIYLNAMVLNQEEVCCPKAAQFLMNECVALVESIVETGRTQREKDSDGRGSSANKRSSRKGNTRSSTSTVRN